MIPVPVRWARTSTVRSPGIPSLVLILAGLLIAIDAAFVLPFSTVAGIGLLLGVAVVVIGISVVPRPSLGLPLGLLAVALGSIAFVVVSGFFIGALLAIVGGASLAVYSQRSWTTTSQRGSGLRPEDLGVVCANCGHRIPPWTSTCPYCATVRERP